MDASEYKETVRGFFKSYSSLLVPIVIGLVGALLFIPTQLMNSKLQEQIETGSISMGNTLQSLGRNLVANNQWEVERGYQQAHAGDANQIELLAEQSTQRELLSYNIFPEPDDSSSQIFKQFGQEFCSAVGELVTRVNARDCPTEAELERIKTGLGGRKSRKMRLSDVGATIIDDLCCEKAESASVYANRADLSGYEFWEEYKYGTSSDSWDQAIRDCWYSQLAYWIIEDVIDTIGALNSASKSVFTSEVKRLLDVSFPESGKKRTLLRATSFTSRAGKKATYHKPSYVLSVEEEAPETCTRRICSDDIDVVHFKVAVVVSTEAVLPFMRELCSAKQHKFKGWDGEDNPPETFKHNQITILEYKIASVDREDKIHELYRYGQDAVVELDLICEYIFNKNGYDKIKPGAVKKSIEESLKEKKAKVKRVIRTRPSEKTGKKDELLDM